MVSYHTLAVTAQAVYAVSRTAPARLVVVDNASTDGYAELFTALADAGLCEVIANREQRYHGPSLTQAMDHLSRDPVRRPAGRAHAGQVAVDGAVALVETVRLIDVLEGRTHLFVSYHMWHDGHVAADQCEGCTFHRPGPRNCPICTSVTSPSPSSAKGPYAESDRYRRFMDREMPGTACPPSLTNGSSPAAASA